MWYPDGYATLSDIHRVVSEAVNSDLGQEAILEATEVMMLEGAILDASDDSEMDMYYRAVRRRIFASCIHEFFTSCSNVAVFSPSGATLHLDKRISAYREIPSLGWQYSFIDSKTGIISAQHWEKCLATAKNDLALLRNEIDEIDKHSPSYERYIELCKIEDVDVELWEVFKKFEGWAIGCPANDLNLNENSFVTLDASTYEFDLFNMTRFPFATLQYGAKPHNRNVRPLVDKIINIRDLNPYKSKAKIFADHFEDLKREAFRAAWVEAAQLRPELSQRGPKPRKSSVKN